MGRIEVKRDTELLRGGRRGLDGQTPFSISFRNLSLKQSFQVWGEAPGHPAQLCPPRTERFQSRWLLSPQAMGLSSPGGEGLTAVSPFPNTMILTFLVSEPLTLKAYERPSRAFVSADYLYRHVWSES